MNGVKSLNVQELIDILQEVENKKLLVTFYRDEDFVLLNGKVEAIQAIDEDTEQPIVVLCLNADFV